MSEKNIFISYKAEEFDQADWVRKTLEHNEISCWMAPDSIPTGSNYAIEIPKAIASCAAMVLILSNKSQNSVWVNKEIEQAIAAKKVIIPFMIEEFEIRDDLNFSLSESQRFAAYEAKEEKTKDMVLAIKGILDMPVDNEVYIEPETVTDIFENAYGKHKKVVYRSVLHRISPAKKIAENDTKLKFTFKVYSILLLITWVMTALTNMQHYSGFSLISLIEGLLPIAPIAYFLWWIGFPICKKISRIKIWNKLLAVILVYLMFNFIIITLLLLFVLFLS